MNVKLEAPRELLAPLLAERRRMGRDRFDEVWEGVLHMVPSPGEPHQNLAGELMMVLGPLAKARGLRTAQDLDLYRPGSGRKDYRQPDLMFYTPPPPGKRVERAELVVEILSPRDESLAKVPFYASLGVREVLLIDPKTRSPVLYVTGTRRPQKGRVRSDVLGVAFARAPGPKLRVTWDGDSSAL